MSKQDKLRKSNLMRLLLLRSSYGKRNDFYQEFFALNHTYIKSLSEKYHFPIMNIIKKLQAEYPDILSGDDGISKRSIYPHIERYMNSNGILYTKNAIPKQFSNIKELPPLVTEVVEVISAPQTTQGLELNEDTIPTLSSHPRPKRKKEKTITPSMPIIINKEMPLSQPSVLMHNESIKENTPSVIDEVNKAPTNHSRTSLHGEPSQPEPKLNSMELSVENCLDGYPDLPREDTPAPIMMPPSTLMQSKCYTAHTPRLTLEVYKRTLEWEECYCERMLEKHTVALKSPEMNASKQKFNQALYMGELEEMKWENDYHLHFIYPKSRLIELSEEIAKINDLIKTTSWGLTHLYAKHIFKK